MGQSISILMVEDTSDDIELVRHELGRRGISASITQVQTAGEMSEALLRGPWDVIIADYHLPTFGAPAALEVLLSSGNDVPFIVVTGSIGEDRAAAIMKMGAHDFILKDKLTRLAGSIERAIGDARVRADHRQAVTSLRSLNHELMTLIDASPLAIMTLDSAGRVGRWNSAAVRLFGWTAEEVAGKDLPTVPDGARLEYHAMISDVRRGRSFSSVEVNWRARDGAQIAVALSMAPLRRSGSEVDGIIAMVSDMSDRRSLEAQVRQIQKMEIVGQLAGGIAHDFNNLLAVISGRCERLLAALSSQPKAHHDVSIIFETGERAARMTRQLLAFSRRQVFTLSEVDINHTVTEMQKMLTALVGSDITLETALSPGLPTTHTDISQLEQVVLNLAVNARDAMSGMGRLTISTSLASAQELSRRGLPASGPCLCLAVADTGTGMDEETRARIFEPFYTTKEQGTGLGLSTVEGIVRQSGGFICVESELGTGSTFFVYLPATPPLALEEESRQFHPEALQNGTTVLVIDDDVAVREKVVEALVRYGYVVFTAANLAQAHEAVALKQGRIHLLIINVVMPQVSGTELASRLLPHCPEMKVLYMTAASDDKSQQQALAQAGVSVLHRPFTASALAAKVRSAVRHHA